MRNERKSNEGECKGLKRREEWMKESEERFRERRKVTEEPAVGEREMHKLCKL